ncbi:hypothetical protein ACFC0S_16035 [Streptomyces sp. NPDC056084]|uniref:hypothetical protein n=1 Tax=unclassified Streptomyces TaxID=2593676 RepID=UPI0035D6CEE6
MSPEPTTPFPARHAAYLAEVDARQAAATDGDWGVSDQDTLVEIVAGLQKTGTGYRCTRQIARLDEDPVDNIEGHIGWDADRDYQQLLNDATFMAHARTDVPRLLAIIAEQQQCLADLVEKVREFRIPLKNILGGYSELTVERGPGPFDALWAVTDGAPREKRFWHDSAAAPGWHYLSDTGPAHAYRHTVQGALAVADEVAAIEGALLDKEITKARAQQAARRVQGGAR